MSSRRDRNEGEREGGDRSDNKSKKRGRKRGSSRMSDKRRTLASSRSCDSGESGDDWNERERERDRNDGDGKSSKNKMSLSGKTRRYYDESSSTNKSEREHKRRRLNGIDSSFVSQRRTNSLSVSNQSHGNVTLHITIQNDTCGFGLSTSTSTGTLF